MYLSFKANHMAELRISVDESYKLMLTEEMVEQFNYVDFIEDILSIRLNEYRNFLLRNLGGDGTLLLDPTHYATLEYILKEEDIIPERWKCKTSGLILFLMNTDISSINRFYNTLLLLKRNDFFVSQYRSRESAPLLADIAPVFGKTEVQNNGTMRTARIFSTSLEMMFFDLISEVKATNVPVNLDVASKLLRRLQYPDNCYELLDDAINTNCVSFCNKHLDSEYSKIGTLQMIYNCLNAPIINNLIKCEVKSAETASWYGEGEDYITSGNIQVIPMHIFSNEYVRDRFACQRYLMDLYDKYRIEDTYRITPNGTEGWIGLIVNKVLSDGYKFRKCIYCNSYSVIRSQNECDDCREHYKAQIKDFKRKDGNRRKNKTNMRASKHDTPIINFYNSLYDVLNSLIHDSFNNMLKEENFDKQKPIALDYELLEIDPCYIDDFRAQDEAEREILAFVPYSEYRYNLLLKLWSMYMIPKRFVKSIFDSNGFANLKNMEADFYEVLDIKKIDTYDELKDFIG